MDGKRELTTTPDRAACLISQSKLSHLWNHSSKCVFMACLMALNLSLSTLYNVVLLASASCPPSSLEQNQIYVGRDNLILNYFSQCGFYYGL